MASGGKSVVGLHSELSANATKFVNEYARADNASRRHGASIRDELDKVQYAVSKKFSAPKLAIAFLKGVGMGGGMGVVHTLYEKWSEALNRATEDAKEFRQELEKSVEEVRKLSETRLDKMISGNFLRGQPAGENSLKALQQQLAAERAIRKTAIADMDAWSKAPIGTAAGGGGDPTGGKYGMYEKGPLGVPIPSVGSYYSDKIAAVEQVAAKRILELEATIERITEKMKEGSEKNKQEMAKWLKPFNDRLEAARKVHESAVDKLKETIASPAEKYAKRAAEIVRLRQALVNPISDADAKRGLAKAWADYQKESNPLNSPVYQRWSQASSMFRGVDEMQKRGMGLGGSYAQRQNMVETILGRIEDLLRTAISNGWAPSYTD